MHDYVRVCVGRFAYIRVTGCKRVEVSMEWICSRHAVLLNKQTQSRCMGNVLDIGNGILFLNQN